jgi:hypothetical protein
MNRHTDEQKGQTDDTVQDEHRDEYPRTVKDEYQRRSRELARSGACSQDAMFFIPKDVVRRSKFRRRTDEF